MSNTSRGQLVRSTLTTLARCWEGCTTPTASALRLKSQFGKSLHGSWVSGRLLWGDLQGGERDHTRRLQLASGPLHYSSSCLPRLLRLHPATEVISSLKSNQISPLLSVKMVSVVSMTTNQHGTTTLSSLSWQVPILKTDGLQSNP